MAATKHINLNNPAVKLEADEQGFTLTVERPDKKPTVVQGTFDNPDQISIFMCPQELVEFYILQTGVVDVFPHIEDINDYFRVDIDLDAKTNWFELDQSKFNEALGL